MKPTLTGGPEGIVLLRILFSSLFDPIVTVVAVCKIVNRNRGHVGPYYLPVSDK